jgi:hypothetical protein
MKLIVTRRRRKSSVYFDIPASTFTWKMNLDMIFEEDENTYVSGTIFSNDSTSTLKLELKQICKHFCGE